MVEEESVLDNKELEDLQSMLKAAWESNSENGILKEKYWFFFF